jgi:hypothetical protein
MFTSLRVLTILNIVAVATTMLLRFVATLVLLCYEVLKSNFLFLCT